MAATVYISESNGLNNAEVVTDNVANLNFGAFDGPNIVPAQHPINVGSNSVAKWWRFKLAALGGSSQVGNIKVWKSSGALVTGEALGGCWTTSSLSFSTLYAHAITTNGSGVITTPYTGDGIVIMGSSFSALPIATALPGTSNTFVGGVQGGNLLAVGYSNYQILAEVTSGATPIGLVNQKVITIQYDEA